MYLDKRFYRKTDLTEDEKKEALEVVELLYAMSFKSRLNGLLSLEYGLEYVPWDFMRIGLQLVVDGTDPETIINIMNNLLFSLNAADFELLKQIIMAEGVLGIQSGTNPQLLAISLNSLIGMDPTVKYMTEKRAGWGTELGLKGIGEYVPQMKNKVILSELTTGLEDKIPRLSDADIKKLLAGFPLNDLGRAVYGASGLVAERIYNNLNKTARVFFIMEMVEFDKDLIFLDQQKTNNGRDKFYSRLGEAQTKLIELINQLVSSGEIRCEGE